MSTAANLDPVIRTWQCPICDHELVLDNKTYRCENNHCFDQSKRGYVNLLPIQNKNSKDPGDNKAMVDHRSNFLHQGFYQPLLNKITEIKASMAIESWLDAGCGEGWYTANLHKGNERADNETGEQCFALDISRHAIHSAARLNKSINWCVASVVNIPLSSDSQDMILSIFSRVDEGEFNRLLNAHGKVIFVGPNTQHLMQLRQVMYKEVREYEVEKQLDYFIEFFEQSEHHPVQFDITVNTKAELESLIAMTPHGWKTSSETIDKLNSMLPMDITCDFNVRVFSKKPLEA